MGEFRMDHKSASQYLDIAANGKGDEKAMLTIAALRRLRSKGVEQSASAVEVGPGGGAALRSLVSAHTLDEAGLLPDRLNISLVELDGLESSMLNDLCNSMHTNDKVSVRILGGDIRYLDSLQIPNVNVVAASAVLHEAYSYGGGYDAIDSSLAAITASLSDGGYFAYRDVLSFDKAVSLHDRTRHIYDRPSWVMFAQKFLPYYMDSARHPYHHEDDKVVFEQDSVRVTASLIHPDKHLTINAPVGVLRELQRHFITFRDYCWRSGELGFTPLLEGELANDWLDLKSGLKRIHYTMSGDHNDTLMRTLSEKESDDLWSVDGDTFDTTTDVKLENLMRRLHDGESKSVTLWNSWLEREGAETYAYMTPGRLLGAAALRSLEVSDGQSIMLPEEGSDVGVLSRVYYNRFLRKQLSNPLKDGKQLILFKLMNTSEDRSDIAKSLDILADWCDKDTIARIYGPIRRVVK